MDAKRLFVVLGVVVISLAAVGVADDAPEAGEVKIPLDKVPAAAKAGILKAVGDGRIVDIGQISEGGKIVRYEVEAIKGGREIDIEVDPSGKILSTGDEGPAPDAPKAEPGKLTPAAEATIKKKWPKATISSIGVEGADGMALHKVILGGVAPGMEAEIAPDGTLVSTQENVEMKALPKPVAAAVKKAVGDATLGKIEKEVLYALVEKGKVYPLAKPYTIFEAKFTKDGKREEVQLDEKGNEPKRPQVWQSTFDVDKKNLVSTGNNPYFPLVVGNVIHLAGGDETVTITVTKDTRVVDGVECRVVEERETEGGKLKEVSRNYFAMDKSTKDVYYFGEEVDVYDKAGKIVSHGGAWLSGEGGARFGLIMPGKPALGQRYYQEYAPKVAMDRAEHVSLNAPLETPYKKFAKTLHVRESSPLESGTSRKWYVAGIGMVGDDALRLVKVEK